MSNRSDLLRILWLLLAALLLRAATPALAMPSMLVPTVGTAIAMTSHCHDAEEQPAPVQAQHNDSSCKIACDLGAAPALIPFQPMDADPAPAVRVARVPILALAEAVPPDHPPPI